MKSKKRGISGLSRENREGWPLLTVETGANGDLSTNERGPSFVSSLGSSWRCTRDFYPALADPVRPVKNIFPHHTLIHFMCSAQQHGLAGVPGRLSLNMCL
jgi:hypothetical protein